MILRWAIREGNNNSLALLVSSSELVVKVVLTKEMFRFFDNKKEGKTKIKCFEEQRKWDT